MNGIIFHQGTLFIDECWIDGCLLDLDVSASRVLAIKSGATRVLAQDLRDPNEVAISAEGACLVSEAVAGADGC